MPAPWPLVSRYLGTGWKPVRRWGVNGARRRGCSRRGHWVVGTGRRRRNFGKLVRTAIKMLDRHRW